MKPSGKVRSVLFATTGLHVGGGIASVNRCILRALEEEQAQHRIDRIDIVSLYDTPNAMTCAGGEQFAARGSRLRFIWYAWRLLVRKPDLLILDHLGLGRALLTFPLAIWKPRSSALFVHGTEFWAVNGGVRAQVVRDANVVLTNSEFTASTIRAKLPEVESKVRPILLCIDPSLIERWKSIEPSTQVPRETAVLIVSRMERGEPGKGHQTLIDAWPEIKKRVPDARLWIVGGGSALEDFRRMALERHADGIEFLGKISDEELSDRYRRAALFAMPSQQEGFGLVYAEAMWHGLPCIGSRADAAREVIRDGVTGAVVPYGEPASLADTISRLLIDCDLRARMGTAARQEAEGRFGFERFRVQLLAALLPGESA